MDVIPISTIYKLNEAIDLMLKYNPVTAEKLRILGYDNEELLRKYSIMCMVLYNYTEVRHNG